VNKLAHRLTQLRKQVGRSALISASGAVEEGLRSRLNDSSLSIRHSSSKKKISDSVLAKKLGAEVLSEGLIYLRTVHSLSSIHDLYNAQNLPRNFRYWPESINKACESLLFIDTETTGLSGGVGTLVFLLGVAEIKNNIVINHQLLLNGMAGEVAMLKWFNQKLTQKQTLVSYNGKSFDIPLLVNRFRLQKIPSPLLTLKHIDLLHWIRRLHKNAWPDCRLPTAEKYCLNFIRKGDVSGAEAPHIWSQLIRNGNVEQLKPLVRHHFWDVLSLVGILDYLLVKLNPKEQENIDVYSVANYFHALGKVDKAKKILESNLKTLCERGLILLAKIYRKESNYEAALLIWSNLAKKDHEISLEFLAKHYEHVCKQYDVSLVYTKQLLSVSKSPLHVKREQRLLRKMNSFKKFD